MKLLTQVELDVLMADGCQTPNCTHAHHDEPLFLHGRCHPQASTGAAYLKGRLSIFCSECGQPIAEIAVAKL